MTFPEGRYFSTPIDIGVEYGGQTRALLMRNRLFVTEIGLRPTVLTFTPRSDWRERRQALLDCGMLLPEIATLNLYEHYRDQGWNGFQDGARDPGARPIDVARCRPVPETDLDGRVWRVAYQDEARRVVVYDYLRADGTAYLRIPKFSFKDPATWPERIERLGVAGEVVGAFDSLGQWFRRWIREMTEGERSFVFIDSRFNAQHLLPMRAPHVHTIYMLHNIHVLSPRHWSSRTTDIYGRVLRRIPGMDAMVTLTDRQREDIALRRGRTNNLFVAPNPVEMPATVVDPPGRDPYRIAIVARLEKQKNLPEAIAAFDLVRRRVPQARLDIYGEGGEREVVQRAISERDLAQHVVLHGHDPQARQRLWQASAFMVTSSYEGWNLAMQESMSHGCPVVSYDVKYGPREQIEDGVNGFLVPHRDVEAMANRVVELLESPALVERMSSAAAARAASSKGRFVQDWKQVLEAVVDLKPRRTTLRHVDLEVDTLHLGQDTTVRFAARLCVAARVQGIDIGNAEVTLSAVHGPTGTLNDLPLSVRSDGSVFKLHAEVPLAQVVAGAPDGAPVSLRLLVVCGNAAWQTRLCRPEGEVSGHEVVDGHRYRFEVTSDSEPLPDTTRPLRAVVPRFDPPRLAIVPAMWKERVNGVLRTATGYQLEKAGKQPPPFPAKKAAKKRPAARPASKPTATQFDAAALEIIKQVKPRTMTGRDKLFALISAVRYVSRYDVPGHVVECGVWRGGSMQTAALSLLESGDTSRELHLFDTFEGMPEPGEKDVRHDGTSAAHLMATNTKDAKIWAIAGLDDVKQGMSEVAYPEDKIFYHQGRVEHTIPDQAPETIAILRLDTDWYESTKHELEHLYHRLSPGGVLIIDDYGYFEGSRLATDEFIEKTGAKLLLLPANSGRVAVKPWA